MLGVEKKSAAKLQEERTVRKICLLDSHVLMAFAGLTADARILINRAQVECQSHKLNYEDPVTLEYITRYIAGLKQRYTQSNGRRPFGISCLIGGFDYDGQPRLYHTDPSGIYYEWKANATGRAAKTVHEFLEKYYKDEEVEKNEGAIKLAIRALLEVVQSGQKTLEVAVMHRDKPLEMLSAETIEKLREGDRGGEGGRGREKEAQGVRDGGMWLFYKSIKYWNNMKMFRNEESAKLYC